MNTPKEPPLILVIVGETASGKSALALSLAKEFNGEIIAADSRTVYRGLDVGTAKPTQLERASIRHHLLDVVEPDQVFTAADFKHLANLAITDISSRDKLPIMAGGSGLYVDSVIFDYKFSAPSAERDPVNPRHLKHVFMPRQNTLRPNTLVIGVTRPRDELKMCVRARAEKMLENGLIEEVSFFGKLYGWETGALQAPAYKAFGAYVRNEISLQEATELFIRGDLNLAKRQRTWFKRNKHIHWTGDSAQVFTLVRSFLNKQHT